MISKAKRAKVKAKIIGRVKKPDGKLFVADIKRRVKQEVALIERYGRAQGPEKKRRVEKVKRILKTL